MTANFEFLGYEPTPLQRYLGIATVKVYGRVLLRYKIVQTSRGCGFFPAAASYKTGLDAYVTAFVLDSRSEEEELFSLIRHNVMPYIAKNKTEEEEGLM